MPLDPSGREQTPKLCLRGRDLEHKRAKGEASCAECRRLKLKCDRKTPCTSCVRRGCQIICPNGSLTSGQGSRKENLDLLLYVPPDTVQSNRFVLANTDKLHGKLLEMSKRIRQLEDALQIAHASVTPTKHPLLSDELLAIKSGVGLMIERDNSDDDDNDGLASGLSPELGTLSISERGEVCFMGRSSSEALLMVIDESMVDHLGEERRLINFPRSLDAHSQQIKLRSEAFPFSSDDGPKSATLESIETFLPAYERATALVEAYLTNIAWSFLIVDREQIFEELIHAVYKRQKRSSGRYDSHDDGYERDYVHQLSLLLSVFAAGAIGDLTLPIGNDEAELYYQLARAALSLKSVFIGASMESVQTILMLASYDFNSCRKYSLEPSWKMTSFGLTLASSIGLHRDPARWNMEPKMVQRRRRLFWEIFTVDKWKSLESGRPAIFNLCEVDCEFPEDKEATLDEDGRVIPSFWHWKYRFTKDVVAPVAEQLCQARALKYSEILELDRKLREFELHPSLLWSDTPEEDVDVTSAMRRYNWAMYRETALLIVHRSFFARAMLENPTKPLGSPFASSLLSAYASALTLLKIMRVYFEKYPNMMLRQWIIWAHGLTCAVILGSVACRGPASPVAAGALSELELTIEVYKEAQGHPVPKRALPFLLRLLGKARNANQPVPKGIGSARQELAILGGAPIFLNKAIRRSSSITAGASPLRHISRRPVDGDERSLDMYQTSAPSLSRRTASSHQDCAPVPTCTSQTAQEWPSVQEHQSNSALDGLLCGNFSRAALSHTTPDMTAPFNSFCSQEHGRSTGHYQNTRDLTSTSWLEELTTILPAGSGQDSISGGIPTSLDFLIGGDDEVASTGMGFPRLEEACDPIISEAWRFLLTGSQEISSTYR